jgi:hypothetical protein
MHLVGGLARRHATSNLHDLEWLKDPVLTVYVGGTIELEKIEIPTGVKVFAGNEKTEKQPKRDEAVMKKIAEFVNARAREVRE